MSNTAGGWLFIAVTFTAIWMMWRFFNFVADLFEWWWRKHSGADGRFAAGPLVTNPSQARELTATPRSAPDTYQGLHDHGLQDEPESRK